MWALQNYSTKEALSSIENGSGSAYFVPSGYVPVLIPCTQVNLQGLNTGLNFGVPVCEEINRCKVPRYIYKSMKEEKDVGTRKRTPRPANAFILYRRDKQVKILESLPGTSNAEVSRLVGAMWKNEKLEVKVQYFQKAELLKVQHKRLYPDYKYQPQRNKKKYRNNITSDY